MDPDDARRRAGDILSRPEYQEQGDTIFDRVLEWIGEQLGRLFLGGGGGIANVVAYLLVIAAVVGIAWVVVKVIRAPGPVSVDAGGDGIRYGTESLRAPSVWLDEADRLAAAGDFRGALRCRHQALIASWITEGVIDHVAGRTAAECHAAADADRVEADISRRVVATFDAVWYGGTAVDADDYRSFAAACDRLGRLPSTLRAPVEST